MGSERRRGVGPDRDSAWEWSAVFVGDASREAYQRALRVHTPLAWDVVEASHDDLLRLLADKIPAELGIVVILGVSVQFGGHPDGDEAGLALLAAVMMDLEPQRARTLLVTLEDAWHNADRQAFDSRAGAIQSALQQGLRRLQATDMPEAEREALGFIGTLVGQAASGGG